MASTEITTMPSSPCLSDSPLSSSATVTSVSPTTMTATTTPASSSTTNQHHNTSHSSSNNIHNQSSCNGNTSNSQSFIKPKLAIVIRNGAKPRKVIRILLNKKTVHSLEQVFGEIAKKLNTGAIKRIYTGSGKQVNSLKDFFNEDDIFIAYGIEKHSHEDLELDIDELKYIYINKTSSLNRNPSRKLNSPSSFSTSTPTSATKRVSSPLSSKTSSPTPKYLSNNNNNNNHTNVLNNNTSNNSLASKQSNCSHSPISHREHLVKSDKFKCDTSNNRNNVTKSPRKQYNNQRNETIKVRLTSRKQSEVINNNHNKKEIKIADENESPFTGLTDSISILFPKEVRNKYDIGMMIGDGNFAVVHECYHRSKRKQYALKIIDKTKCRGKEAVIANEVAILRSVKHPNIIQLYEDFDYINELYLVMELATGGDLFDAIAEASKFNEEDAKGMIYDLCNALAYLHSLCICHRDIKPENLLFGYDQSEQRKSLKIGDFGLAVEIRPGEKLTTVCGTPTYVAPEILAELGYDHKVDIWAAGVIAYILLSGYPPFVSQVNDQDELFDRILTGKFEFNSTHWDHITKEAKQLITNMLKVNPNSRYTAIDVVNHPWLVDGINHNFYSKLDNY